MKSTTVIIGCALAAGLMTFASGKVQAGTVIDNSLYSALKVKATLTFVDSNDKFKKMSFSNKDILSASGTSGAGHKLALNDGDVYVIDKDAVLDNLTQEGYTETTLDEYISVDTTSKNGHTDKHTGQGYIDSYFYDSPTTPRNVVNLYGVFSDSQTDTYNNNNSTDSVSSSLKANSLAAESYTDTGEGLVDFIPGSGSISANGSGKLNLLQ
jgi:hypothetical protein